jgi:hypothetical protein
MNFLINNKIKIMRKRTFFNCLIAASFVIGLAFMSGCEGPTGPPGPAGRDGTDGTDGADGTDGTDGVDGNVTCLQCHSAETPQIILEQFNQSVHASGQVAVDYAGGRSSCARCHSSEGFIEYARTGTVEENISSPSAWECKTCHSIHSTFEEADFALRLADPIEWNYDTTGIITDLGNSNLCANCHQSRRSGPYDMGGELVDLDDDDSLETVVPDGYFYISSTHYGPHHGPQANVLAGRGFSEMAGSWSYPAAETSPHMVDSARCTGCHMYDYGNGAGGHTWNPALDACNNCHQGADDPDFDHNNVQTETAALLEDLRDLLEAQGVIELGTEEVYELNPETGAIELVVHVEGYHPVVGLHTVELSQAFFNWIGLEEDRSLGAHNSAYVKALLENSIESITP